MSAPISSRFQNIPSAAHSPAKLTYSRISPIGSNSARQNETVRIRLPSMRVATYFDPTASFISFDMKSAAAVTGMPLAGVGAIWRSAVVRCAGQQLSIIDQQQLFRNIQARSLDKEVLKNDMQVMLHTGENGGASFTANETKKCVEMLSNLSDFFAQNQYIPLFSNDAIELDLTLGDANYPFSYGTGQNASDAAALADAIELTNITLHLGVLELALEVDRTVVAEHSGLWTFPLENVQYVPFTVNSGATNAVLNLGLSCSSLSKVEFVFTTATGPETLPHNVFPKLDLAKAELLIDGTPVLPSGMDCSSDAITVAYARVAKHALHDEAMYERRDNTDFTVKDYIVSFDLESIARGAADYVRSGVNVSSSTVQLVLTWGTALAAQTNVHIYAYHNALVSFDASGSGTRSFELSI